MFYFFRISDKNFLESAFFHCEMVGLTNFRPDRCVCIVNVMISIKNIRQKSSGPVLMNCWRSPLCWSLIFCKTYKFLCNMWCVMCDAWCVMLQTWFFVKSWLYESRGDQKHTIWVISDLFNDIPKLIPGGSRMYTMSCKASYGLYSVSFIFVVVYLERVTPIEQTWDMGKKTISVQTQLFLLPKRANLGNILFIYPLCTQEVGPGMKLK